MARCARLPLVRTGPRACSRSSLASFTTWANSGVGINNVVDWLQRERHQPSAARRQQGAQLRSWAASPWARDGRQPGARQLVRHLLRRTCRPETAATTALSTPHALPADGELGTSGTRSTRPTGALLPAPPAAKPRAAAPRAEPRRRAPAAARAPVRVTTEWSGKARRRRAACRRRAAAARRRTAVSTTAPVARTAADAGATWLRRARRRPEAPGRACWPCSGPPSRWAAGAERGRSMRPW